MAPSAITPPQGVQETSELTAAAVAGKIAQTAPGLLKRVADPLNSGVKTTLRPLDASRLRFTRTTTPMTVPQPGDPIIATASQCTDHMITAVWRSTTGWGDPELRPYGNLSLAPTASVLHYATECFEGMKMYRGFDRKLRLFRPDSNCKRMLVSSTRIALPGFDPKELEKLIIAMIAVDGPKWLPKAGTFLYLRPTMIGSAGALGVATPKEATLFVIATFMPPLGAPQGLKLLASTDGVRAWPGGFGFAKVGANYGPSLMANGEARARGYDQVLWLLNGQITEAGASNFFVMWKSKEGKTQLVTAPLGDKIILDGVTRRSILQLTRERLSHGRTGQDPVEIVERQFTMEDIVQAVNEGRILEAFAAGTAYFVCPVSVIHYKNQDLQIPMSQGDSGPYTALVKSWLVDIMYGREQHEWGVVVEEEQPF
ncbi:putative branched-chain-amino-acid aminotransferase [Hyaloscypha bicolor E]|uniref:Branched-chain-amino-acid aminotransferase n=1 Tax=Hyaloscypha bicolor E TaxID=1095630 RepID=A0A2J6T1S9_9HELO|nr:putative branched-chain-amino-acid aminotransferase [Hyaloscypha bicolor E]PMD56970.1 putative branched-chain-amino-acid aminotransferase [Hyaloscypha bicolor E]